MGGEGQVLLVLRGTLLLVLDIVKRRDRERIIRLLLHRCCRGRRGNQALKEGGGGRPGRGYRSGRGRRLVEVQGVPLLVGRGRPRRVSGVTRAGGRDQGGGAVGTTCGGGCATSILPLLLLLFVRRWASDWLVLML